MNTPKIPNFDSIQVLADFWDTHDLTGFEDQLEEVTEPIFVRESLVQIHLPPMEVAAIKQVAQQRGVDYTDLIREWVLEKIYTPS